MSKKLLGSARSSKRSVATQTVDGHAAHVRTRKIWCNKDDCTACPHGPYKYLVWRDDDGRIRERYLGKDTDQ